MSSTTYEFDDQLFDLVEIALVGSIVGRKRGDVFKFAVPQSSMLAMEVELDPMRIVAALKLILERLLPEDIKLHSSIAHGLVAILEDEANRTKRRVVGSYR